MSTSSRSTSHLRELFIGMCSSHVAAGTLFLFMALWASVGMVGILAVLGHTAEFAAANVPRLVQEELRDVLEECKKPILKYAQ
ncbi:hypothetical protein ARMGADRAFT_1165129 [Armillaria gallica]|uniref:Uncharacterized protein n=1 Tax=Armillaria gallica TaxID=47427 RepID=A0A2H3DX79_ARMGA|nr:hypothetical protein ARMGADRAFT_1165129 [Armillaria gallica]